MKRPFHLLPALLALIFVATPAVAQDDSLAQSATPPGSYSILITFGDDPCPEAAGDEIIVCAQRPESDRYRVPKELREEIKADYAGGGSWAAAVEGYDDIARTGRPGSCSPVGSFGFTGCAAAALRQWFAEKRAR